MEWELLIKQAKAAAAHEGRRHCYFPMENNSNSSVAARTKCMGSRASIVGSFSHSRLLVCSILRAHVQMNGKCLSLAPSTRERETTAASSSLSLFPKALFFRVGESELVFGDGENRSDDGRKCSSRSKKRTFKDKKVWALWQLSH